MAPSSNTTDLPDLPSTRLPTTQSPVQVQQHNPLHRYALSRLRLAFANNTFTYNIIELQIHLQHHRVTSNCTMLQVELDFLSSK